MFSIYIQTVDHKKQRYKTVGDWIWNKDQTKLIIRVSKMNDWRFEFLVAIHELVEVVTCYYNGIHQKEVDEFDIQFEEDRKRKIHSKEAEPGDDPSAPYHLQHGIATAVERMMAFVLNVTWDYYCEACEELYK